ncbi:MAG TPA: hypothetical protein VKU83_02655, partial [Puia sp.]|nr:hypothetical protein [Puia sp.]
ERTQSLESRTAVLDSVVRQQAHLIVELKRLNSTAIRTIVRLQRNFDQYQERERSAAQTAEQ